MKIFLTFSVLGALSLMVAVAAQAQVDFSTLDKWRGWRPPAEQRQPTNNTQRNDSSESSGSANSGYRPFTAKEIEQQRKAKLQMENTVRRNIGTPEAVAWSKTAVVANGNAGSGGVLPSVDPAFFAMPNEAEHIANHLEALAQQKIFLEAERAKLKNIQGGVQQLVLENIAASRDLMQDTESQTVSVIEGLLSMMKLPPQVSTSLSTAMPMCQFYFLHRAFSTTSDATRAHDKMIESVGQMEETIVSNPLVFSSAEGDSVKAAMDVVLKVYKIADRHANPYLNSSTRADMEDANGILQDAIQTMYPSAGRILKAGTGYPNMIVASYAMERLEGDRLQIESALEQNTRALDYFDERITQVEKDQTFYRERMMHFKH